MVIVELEIEDMDSLFTIVLNQKKDQKEAKASSVLQKIKGVMKQAKYASEWGILLKGYLQRDKAAWIKKDSMKIRHAINTLAAKKTGFHISSMKVLDE